SVFQSLVVIRSYHTKLPPTSLFALPYYKRKTRPGISLTLLFFLTGTKPCQVPCTLWKEYARPSDPFRPGLVLAIGAMSIAKKPTTKCQRAGKIFVLLYLLLCQRVLPSQKQSR